MSFKYIPVTNLKTIGINDSADSLFRDGDYISDKYSSALREYFQNSIDAVRKSKNKRLQFNVKLENLDLDFFDFKDLEKMISKCIKTIEANQSGADNIEIKRFRNIIKDCKEVNSEFVECVVFEDNGLGLDGGSIASKGNKNTGWSRIIGDDISDKNHGELGSFGIGKSTAFSIANLNTIFYLSSHKQKNTFLGYTKLGMTYSEPNKFENYGPEVYFGELKKINNSEIADVTEVGSKFKDKYRSIEGPGLSTIIPVVDFLKNNEIKNFIDFTLFTLFQSFVVWFSENEFEITVSDKKNNQIKTINNSNYKQEIENLSNSEIFDNDDFKYDYELFKTFALDKNINEIPENGVREIEVKKEYKGKINIKLFKNEKLKDYSNKPSQRGSRSTKLNKNFRIIRNGMTIRSEKFPQKITGLINPSLCGYITYDTAKLNELIGYLETASHDKFNYTRIEKAFFHDKKNFPSKQSVSKFINDSNKFLKEILEAISYSDSDIENTYFIKVDSGDENTNKGLKTESSSFYTNIKVERKMQKKENVIPKLLKPDLEGRKGGVVSNPGGDGEVEPPYFPGGPGGGGTRRVPGSRSKLSSINYLSKLIEKEGSNSKYLIQLANIKELDKFDLFITQDSISRNSITSFIIKNVEIRKKNIDSNADQIERKDFVEELNKNNLVKGYRISNIDCTNHEKLFIEIKLHEPSSTNSRFKITFLEST